MAMEIRQSAGQQEELRQEQVLTHRQIQALEMLAAPVQDLQAVIRIELERNPVLEIEGETEFTSLLPENPPESKELDDPDGGDPVDAWLALDAECPEPAESFAFSPEDQRRREHYLESITVRPSFQDELLVQLKFRDDDDGLREGCEWIISGLDDDGYLSTPLADLAMASGLTMDQLEKAMAAVQACEPAGIGARNLQERLLLQLQRQGREGSLVYQLVRDHLSAVAANKLPAVARKLRVNLDDLYRAMAEVRNLHPHVLLHAPSTPMEYVEAEATVTEKAGRLEVTVPHENLPSLRISETYREMLDSPDTPDETRDYIRKKIGAAINFMNNISQRQTTLQRIVAAIVETQEAFFRLGPEHLRPLVMAQIATKLSIHETTVSRAVSGKFLGCKYGLYPLRKFFTAALRDDAGNEVSNAVIKEAIRDLIGGEDAAAPLSDNEIVTLLKKRNLKVARRTVAKYREALTLPPSYLRRRFA